MRQPMVVAFALVCSFVNSGMGGRMSTAVRQTRFFGIARVIGIAALLALPVCSVSQDRQNAANTGKDENEIKHLISMYAKAADQADPTLASGVWCDSSEDSLVNPVGRWHGTEQIMGFYRHDMGEMYSARDLKISEVSIHVFSDAAWAEFNWDFSAKRRNDGSAVSFHGTETQIYHKNHDSWCLVHVHYSTLPAEKRAKTD
jgi:ketosteroid isomerase-like protein